MARFELDNGPLPLHYQVYRDLVSGLDAGEWQAGDQLPPERELARRYGCSVITVRRALDELVREKRLKRTRGRGTFVLDPRLALDLADSLSFTELMHAHGMDPNTKLVGADVGVADEAVAQALDVEPGTPTLDLERLRSANGEPLLLEQVHLVAERFPELLSTDLENRSLYDVMRDEYGEEIVQAREAIEPVLLRTHEADLLQQPRRKPALLIEGIAFDADDRPIEFTRTYVRGDRTRIYVDRLVVRPGLSR